MSRPRQAAGGAGAPVGQVRIVGGRWRNTKLAVPALPGLRPSSDRVRETLFNWLMPQLPGARVLDLFAGTGALGLEAVSRGASHATLIERDPQLVRALHGMVERLQAGDQVSVVQADVLHWLQQAPSQLADIALMDPPFADGLWDRALVAVARHLTPQAWLYVEAPAGTVPAMGAEWMLHREGSTNQVRFALYRRAAATL